MQAQRLGGPREQAGQQLAFRRQGLLEPGQEQPAKVVRRQEEEPACQQQVHREQEEQRRPAAVLAFQLQEPGVQRREEPVYQQRAQRARGVRQQEEPAFQRRAHPGLREGPRPEELRPGAELAWD